MNGSLIRSLLLVFTVVLIGSPLLNFAEDEPSTLTAERQALLKEMRSSAGKIKVLEVVKGKSNQAQLSNDPLFRYSDEQRQIRDATMWAWTVEGRPVSLMKLECYGLPDPENRWLFNVVSATPDTLKVDWTFGKQFASKAPGMKFELLKAADNVAETKTARLIQLKQLARRFTATMTGDSTSTSKTEMRLLPTPLLRYSSPAGNILDGALFGFSATGTNPDSVLAIQWRGDIGTARCEYALTGMTTAALDVRIDDVPCWSQPYLLGRGQEFDNWTWFFSGRSE